MHTNAATMTNTKHFIILSFLHYLENQQQKTVGGGWVKRFELKLFKFVKYIIYYCKNINILF